MINIRMNMPDVRKLSPKITVVGVGGAGGNAVNNMITSRLEGVEFVVCNTDAQAIQGNLADHKIQLGEHITSGLGAGARPEVGRAAAEESMEEVLQFLENANMVFITAGMGGGTGTGAAPVIAKACREKGILTVGVVTKPFHFEGTLRMRMAEEGIKEMQEYVDTLIVIPNQNLFRVVNEKTTFSDAFKMADTVLQSGVRGVTDLIVMPGLINLDFADIRSVMQEMGKAVMGTGEASGERRAIEAAEKAISNPLLDDVSMKGARGVIINVTGGYDMTLFEVDEACNRIRDEVDPNANIIFGSTFDESLEGIMRVSVVATGIDVAVAEKKPLKSSGAFTVERTAPKRVEAPVEARDYTQTVAKSAPAAYPAGPAYAASAAPAPRAPSYAPAPSYAQPAASYQPSYAPAQPAAQMSEQPAASYRQQELVMDQPSASYAQPSYTASSYQTQGAAAVAYDQAPVQTQQQSQADYMRGTRYRDSYIPPLPVDSNLPPVAQMARSNMTAAPAGGSLQMPAQDVITTSVPVSDRPARKKSPSLFERITGQIKRDHHAQEDLAAADDVNAAAQPALPGADLRAPQRASYQPAPQMPQQPQQGRLNIDSPAKPASPAGAGEGDFDIPAFLRRQAN